MLAANLFEGDIRLDSLGAIGIGKFNGHTRFRLKMVISNEILKRANDRYFHLLEVIRPRSH